MIFAIRGKEIGDTFLNPKFVETGKGLMRHDYAVANPMWNQSNYDTEFYEKDPWKRFEYGTPSKPSADWGWVQHILASLNDQGRAGILLDLEIARSDREKADKDLCF